MITSANEERYFRDVIAHHSKSFAMASKLLPPNIRAAVAVVYAWCRRCDDAVDRVPPGMRAAFLVRLQDELSSIYEGPPPADPVLLAFQKVVFHFRIPPEYPAELLRGMRMDVERARYDSLEDLLIYCYRVAGTVGLMLCHVMGLRDAAALRHAAHLGIAMQLTNICRDVREDWELGRMYLPRMLVRLAGESGWTAPPQRTVPPSLRKGFAVAVERLLRESERYYRSAEAGMFALPWRSALAVRAASFIYAAIGEKLARAGCDAFAGRAVTSRWTKLWLVLRASVLTLSETPRRIALPFRAAKLETTVRFPRDVLPI